MSRIPWCASAGAIAWASFVSCACSAPTACRAESEPGNAADVTSAKLSDTALLSNAGDSAAFALDVTLTGLPVLWPAGSAVKDAEVGVGVTLGYTAPPLGGDGNTQMPRVRVSLGERASTVTRPFTSGVEGTRSPLFDDCNLRDAAYCCAFGSAECQARVQVIIERLDGAPFPPVQVKWSAGANGTVDSCPQDRDAPVLTLTNEAL